MCSPLTPVGRSGFTARARRMAASTDAGGGRGGRTHGTGPGRGRPGLCRPPRGQHPPPGSAFPEPTARREAQPRHRPRGPAPAPAPGSSGATSAGGAPLSPWTPSRPPRDLLPREGISPTPLTSPPVPAQPRQRGKGAPSRARRGLSGAGQGRAGPRRAGPGVPAAEGLREEPPSPRRTAAPGTATRGCLRGEERRGGEAQRQPPRRLYLGPSGVPWRPRRRSRLSWPRLANRHLPPPAAGWQRRRRPRWRGGAGPPPVSQLARPAPPGEGGRPGPGPVGPAARGGAGPVLVLRR